MAAVVVGVPVYSVAFTEGAYVTKGRKAKITPVSKHPDIRVMAHHGDTRDGCY